MLATRRKSFRLRVLKLCLKREKRSWKSIQRERDVHRYKVRLFRSRQYFHLAWHLFTLTFYSKVLNSEKRKKVMVSSIANAMVMVRCGGIVVVVVLSLFHLEFLDYIQFTLFSTDQNTQTKSVAFFLLPFPYTASHFFFSILPFRFWIMGIHIALLYTVFFVSWFVRCIIACYCCLHIPYYHLYPYVHVYSLKISSPTLLHAIALNILHSSACSSLYGKGKLKWLIKWGK